ncbi:MAG: hypothetical protein KAZ98_04825, partial [Prevotella sp.]|nr:hypothetical protein [Prevotella sp.]
MRHKQRPHGYKYSRNDKKNLDPPDAIGPLHINYNNELALVLLYHKISITKAYHQQTNNQQTSPPT